MKPNATIPNKIKKPLELRSEVTKPRTSTNNAIMNNQNHLTFETNQSNDSGFTCVFLAEAAMAHSPEEFTIYRFEQLPQLYYKFPFSAMRHSPLLKLWLKIPVATQTSP